MSSNTLNLKDLEKDVDKAYRDRTVATIKFTSVTPWWGRDFDGKTSNRVDEDAIVGRLRWFLRTVYNRFCADEAELLSYNSSDKFVSSFLGGEESASTYSFFVSDVEVDKSHSNDYKRLLRYAFLSLGSGRSESIEPIDIKSFTLSITRNTDYSDYDQIVVDGTILTLSYIGVGGSTNRGFGRFIPYFLDSQKSSEALEYVKRGEIFKAFDNFYRSFSKLKKEGAACSKSNSWESSAVPLTPLTQEDGPDTIKFISECSGVQTALDAIQKAFLKSTIKNELKRKHYNINLWSPAPFIHTWLYGLPRGSGKKSKDSSMHNGKKGYYVLDEHENLIDVRRSSMFILTPVKNANHNKYKIYLLPFLSLKDHEEFLESKNLVHVGYHKNSKEPHRASVRNILKGGAAAKNELYEIEKQMADNIKIYSYGDLKNLIINYENILLDNIKSGCYGYGRYQ